MYKLIAIDMDGTLLKDNKTISIKNKEALKKAGDLGLKIVLTSGRPIQGIKNYLNELQLTGNDDYVIGMNGGLIYKSSDFSIISTNAALKGSDVKYIYNNVKCFSKYFHAFTKDEDLINVESEFSEGDRKRLNIRTRVVDFLSDIRDDDEISKIGLEEKKDALDKIASQIPKVLFEKYNIVRSADFMLEFLQKDCNKALGIEKLAQYLGISREDIIAIGDSDNDREMIEYAGLGIAMANAKDEVKALADFITKSNEDDGVAYAIEKFVINAF